MAEERGGKKQKDLPWCPDPTQQALPRGWE